MNSVEELLLQRFEGTDDLSLAQGLAHFALAILTAPVSEISDKLFEGNPDADKLLKLLDSKADYAMHCLKVLRKQIRNFDALCTQIRADLRKQVSA